MVGTGVAAEHGVFIKSGAALERGSKVDTVVFDKTGTVTLGHPTVVKHLMVAVGVPLKELQMVLGSLETASEHPLAHAVVQWAVAGLGKVRGQKLVPLEMAAPAHGSASLEQRKLSYQDVCPLAFCMHRVEWTEGACVHAVFSGRRHMRSRFFVTAAVVSEILSLVY
jgi:magnesium-transporting ATPase (P-type)